MFVRFVVLSFGIWSGLVRLTLQMSHVSYPLRDIDVVCLSEVPISQLLRIKKSVQQLSCDRCDEKRILNDEAKNGIDLPVESKQYGGHNLTALPLTDNMIRRSNDRHDYWNEKPTKVQTIFQFSVTALAFLAFGGYLLCMIVQAIKSKGTTYFHPSIVPSATGNAGPLKKIKVYRRSRRGMRTSRNATFHIDQLGEPSPDELYKVLVSLAEGYVKIASI